MWTAILEVAEKKPEKIQASTEFEPVPPILVERYNQPNYEVTRWQSGKSQRVCLSRKEILSQFLKASRISYPADKC